jgi:hypothetical protein
MTRPRYVAFDYEFAGYYHIYSTDIEPPCVDFDEGG